MFVEASIIVGAILCAKAAAVTYAYVYHRDRFDAECERCERATRGLSWQEEEGEDAFGGGKEEEEPVAPKRMKDVKRGRSFKKMFSGKKEKEKKKRRNAGGGEKET